MGDYKTLSDIAGNAFFQKIQSERNKQIQEYCNRFGVDYIEVGETGRKELEESYDRYITSEIQKQQDKQTALHKLKVNRENIKRFENKTPLRFRNLDIASFNNQNLVNKLLNGASALILGNNGTRKTGLAYCLCSEWVKKGDSVQIEKAQVLLSKIKGQERPYKFIDDTYKNTDHLVIDEIDKIFESRADFIYLSYLVDVRYEWCKQSIVIGNTNRTNKEEIRNNFISVLGQSIFSRLCGDGGTFVTIANSPDCRFAEVKDD